jgi:predicted dehydrogenase/threonine dehydrogenase-like Zn-dependent dehydrogenase
MAIKQVLIKDGKAMVEEIPAPQVEKGTVLVRVEYSCISIGTELSGLKTSGLPLWKRALQQPDNVRKALQMVAAHGLTYTRSLVEGKLSGGTPTGYSAAGVVLETGAGIDDLQPGDRVACAGAQCAHHAEVICVPRNLTVPLPEKLDPALASTATLGAIAMQGVRRAQPTLGETFVVIGLGIIGQLTAQLLRVNGCRVIGADLDQTRIRLAKSIGMDYGLDPEAGIELDQVARLTGGLGADGVIITAATASNEVVSTAFQMCRKKGRVVLVGDVGLRLNRADFYQKELDFFISSSYGPGRYDSKYEEEGLDYPAAYVRWTENRNLAEYLRLLSEDKIKVQPLIDKIYPITEAPAAYEILKNGSGKPLMVLLSYPKPDVSLPPARVVSNPLSRGAGQGQIRLALVGAGGFARGMHLPNLQQLANYYHLQAVMSRTGHNAMAAARQFGAGYATTDFQRILEDPEVDAVLIATRHNLHAGMALEALQAGKHVLVEKPLALTREELEGIKAFFATLKPGENMPVLLTGFNRRFSRYAVRLRQLVEGRGNPMILNYRMNAGYLPPEHWAHTEEGGGRNKGEACHIYDLFTFLTGGKVAAVDAWPITPASGYYQRNDNFVAVIKFEDGSVATLTYTALGSKDYPKETMEIFVDGKVLTLNDYKQLSVFGSRAGGINSKFIDKGQKDELAAFARAIQEGGPWPIPLWQQVQAAEIALAVEEKIGAAR